MSNLENKGTCGTSCGCGPESTSYWQDVENKVVDAKNLSQEFSDGEFDSFSVKKTRRSFLKIMGFSVSALPLTGCIKIPVKKALPYLNKQDHATPGVPNWYASTFKGIPVLVKTREGRPIKIEGNDKSLVTFGGAGAQQQASVISLYDDYRYKSASIDNKDVEWDAFDVALKTSLKNNEGDIVLVTSSLKSPSELSIIAEFAKSVGAKHIAYDAISTTAFALANEKTHGVYTHSEYNFENADIIVSIGADFLSTWGNGIAQSKQYVARRDVKHESGMSRHYQVEANMSMTGTNADYRYTKSMGDQRDILLGLLSEVSSFSHSVKASNKDIVSKMAKDLKANAGRSLVVAGDNDKDIQIVVNKINEALRNYGTTVFVYQNQYEKLAKDSEFTAFVADMNAGKVGTAIFVDVNPSYDYFDAASFNKGLAKVNTRVSMAMSADETSSRCNFVAPRNHTYESWSDAVISNNEISIIQPVIQPLFGSRMYTETLMSLVDNSTSFHDYMQSFWAKKFYKSSGSKELTSGTFWNRSLHDGVITVKTGKQVPMRNVSTDSHAKAVMKYKVGSGLNIIAYVKDGIEAGDMSNNPFIQEMPNPVTKATWDNYIMVSPKYAKAQGIKTGDELILNSNGYEIKLPAMVQPGTEENTVAVAIGYGRTVAGKVAKNLGANAYPFLKAMNGSFSYTSSFGSIKKSGKTIVMAQTQSHHSMEGRDIVRETTFADYLKNPKSGNTKKARIVHIYPEHKKNGHQWGMAVDLSKCTGCSACIISCNTENNIPVVGRQEVANRREMHWLRIDRYYKGDEQNPETVHMPMLCQHCDNAPCENVCPVMATVQSSEGLNQQVYNRCVGTRYCANNCPYKVRRFNWFNYDRSDKVQSLALNPDVSIRTRGIMEKCSMCVQRIQAGKLEAKRERRELRDGDIKLACQQSCPGDGIVFGDLKDPSSKISKFVKDERNYTVIEELNTQNRVSYLTKVRNK